MKINKGDLVEIVRPGHCWPEYFEKFKELGMENPEKSRKSLSKGAKGVVLNFTSRPIPEELYNMKYMVITKFIKYDRKNNSRNKKKVSNRNCNKKS